MDNLAHDTQARPESAIDDALAGHWIVTLEFVDGPLASRRMLAPALVRMLYFSGWSSVGRPLVSTTPQSSPTHRGQYCAQRVYDCTSTNDCILEMRWTSNLTRAG